MRSKRRMISSALPLMPEELNSRLQACYSLYNMVERFLYGEQRQYQFHIQNLIGAWEVWVAFSRADPEDPILRQVENLGDALEDLLTGDLFSFTFNHAKLSMAARTYNNLVLKLSNLPTGENHV